MEAGENEGPMRKLNAFKAPGHTSSGSIERSAEMARGVLLLRTIKDAFVPPFRVEKLSSGESF